MNKNGILAYDSNNSGGDWWLKDADWKKLSEAGWNVHWGERRHDDLLSPCQSNGKRWLGAIACKAAKKFDTARDGIEEWESITGQASSELGCNCCGPPHNFEWVCNDGTTTYFHAESSGSYLTEH